MSKDRDTKHHIIPRSRGGKSDLENITYLPGRQHEAYHFLFSNKTPDEIIDHLVKRYWRNNWEYVRSAYQKYSI